MFGLIALTHLVCPQVALYVLRHFRPILLSLYDQVCLVVNYISRYQNIVIFIDNAVLDILLVKKYQPGMPVFLVLVVQNYLMMVYFGIVLPLIISWLVLVGPDCITSLNFLL